MSPRPLALSRGLRDRAAMTPHRTFGQNDSFLPPTVIVVSLSHGQRMPLLRGVRDRLAMARYQAFGSFVFRDTPVLSSVAPVQIAAFIRVG